MLYLEKKDHLINKVPNLTPEQKAEAIAFFNKSSTRENEIDWNDLKNLTWADFEKVIKKQTKTGREKAVKKHGVKGLEEGKDYDIVYSNKDHTVEGYLLYNYDASRLIASEAVGGVEGKWCIAFQKTNSYWRDYTYNQGKRFIVFVDYDHFSEWKKGIVVFNIDGVSIYQYWDRFDEKAASYTNESAVEYISYATGVNRIELKKSIEKAKELVKKNEDIFKEKGLIAGLDYTIDDDLVSSNTATFTVKIRINSYYMETESVNNYIKKFPTDFTTKVQVYIPDNNKGILLYSDITTANTAIGNEGLDFTVKEDLNGKSSISIHSEKRNFNIDYIIEALKARFNITIEGKDEFENHLVHSILISIKDWVFLDFADRDFGFIAITDLDVSKFLPFISDVLIGEKNTFNTADFNNIFVMSQECLKHPTTMLENILNNFH